MPDDPNVPATPDSDPSDFTDSASLGADLLDKRVGDTKQSSTYADALALIDPFAQEATAGAWSTTLSRDDVSSRLRDMLTGPAIAIKQPGDARPDKGPRSLRQGSLNLCGPAAFFQMALQRDPVVLATVATSLFDRGSATMGKLSIAPDSSLLQADFSAMLSKASSPFTAAEWMLFGALRNSTNVFWQGGWQGDPSQMLAALTRPEELAGWMRDCGIWSEVEDHGKWATNPGVMQATSLTLPEGTDVALLIHVNLIAKSTLRDPLNPDQPLPGDNPARLDNTFLLSSFPNHWVVLLSEPMVDAKQENVLSTIWTWGRCLCLQTPVADFNDNYYGAVIAKL